MNIYLDLISQRSRATRRITQYLLVFLFVQPIALAIILPDAQAWKASLWVTVPISLLWLAYDSIRTALDYATDNDVLRTLATQREIRVEAAQPQTSHGAAEVFINTDPDEGTNSTSVKQTISPNDLEAYIQANKHLMSEAEILALRNSINRKPGYEKALGKLLNLTRKKQRERGESPSPTVEFSL